MKVPFTANQNQQSVSSKPVIDCNNNIIALREAATFQGNTAAAANNNNNNNNLCYEPKSVLDLRRSPSPATTEKHKSSSATDISSVCDDPLQLEDHVLLNHFEDWDSLMRDLGLQEDSTTTAATTTTTTLTSKPVITHHDPPLTHYISLPDFPTLHSFDSTNIIPSDFTNNTLSGTSLHSNSNDNNNPFELSSHNNSYNWNIGFDYVDELIRFAECFETNSVQLAHVILARLNQRLKSASGKPLQRAAFYFKEALQTLLTGSTRLNRPSNSSEVIQTIKAYKSFSNISPVPLFSSFTANQAMLEALDGSGIVHIVDFDIGLGCHWASFMKELSDKSETRKTTAPILRITAIVPDEYAAETRLIRENLTQFARDLNIRFDIEFVLIRTFEFLSFKAIKFIEGEKVAVLLTPAIFRRAGPGFANDLHRVSPHVVVHVDSEGLMMGFGTSSYRQTVIDGLEFYSTLLESLEAANGGDDWIKRIETFVLYPKILEAVGAANHRGTPWREAFVAAGLRPVGLSQFADFQAECLLRRVQVRGFHVAKRQSEMLLCWHERALVATSVWRS